MKPLTVPYRLLVLLLYGNHDFMERTGSKITASVSLTAKAINCKRPAGLAPHLLILEELGLIRELKQHKHMFTCKLLCPIGMEWNMGEAISV